MEDKLAQVARLLASEIEELKEAVATQKAGDSAPNVSPSDLEDIAAQLKAADARHAQLLQELAGKADAATAVKQQAHITESLEQISALRQQLLEHSRLHSAAQAQLADSDSERLDAAERALEELQQEKWEYTYTDHAQGESIELRLERAEATITTLQRSSEEAAAAAAASGGNSFQARLFQAEERIKGLSCLVKMGLSNSEGDIAELKQRLDGCAEGSKEPGSLEQRLHSSEEEIAALKKHVGGYLLNMNGEDCLENRVCRAEAQLYDLKETAKGDAQVFGEFESRLKQAEDEISAAWEHLYGDSDPTGDVPDGDVFSRLAAAELDIKRLQNLTGNHKTAQQGADELAEQLQNAEDRIDDLWDVLGLSATAEAPGADGSEELQGRTVLSRLEAAERTVAQLQEEMTCRHSEVQEGAQKVMSRLEEAEDDIADLYAISSTEELCDEHVVLMGDISPRVAAAEREITRLQQLTSKHDSMQQGGERFAEQLKMAEDEIQCVWDLLRPSAMDEALGTRNAIARLKDADAENKALQKRVWFDDLDKKNLDGMSIAGRLCATEWLVRVLQTMVAEDSEAAQDTAKFLARLEMAEDNIAALKQQRSEAGMDAKEAMMRLKLVEKRISKLTTLVDGLADVAQALPEKTTIESSPESEGIPEAKWRDWLEQGVPKSEWQKFWMLKCSLKEAPETGTDDTTLKRKLQDIKSGLHSELRGDYWGLDIKGFQAKDAAVDSKAAQQVRDVT